MGGEVNASFSIFRDKPKIISPREVNGCREVLLGLGRGRLLAKEADETAYSCGPLRKLIGRNVV